MQVLIAVRFARDSRVHVIVLIVANPGLALHEIQVRLQVGAARCGKELWQEGCVKDDQCDAHAARFGGHMQLVQVLGQRGEVDAVLAVLCIGIEFKVVAEAAAKACAERVISKAVISDGWMRFGIRMYLFQSPARWVG